MILFYILAVPIILSAISFFAKNLKALGRINAIGHLSVMLATFYFAITSKLPLNLFGLFYIDALSVFFIFVITIVTFAAALFSIDYINKDVASGNIKEKKAKFYYALFNFFSFSMLLVPMVANLGMVWVGIELTTLASTFLVGFYNNKTSIEAAWKYIIICSVGIIFALLGTIIFYYAVSSAGLAKTLNWHQIVPFSKILGVNIVKIAFLFILVCYGTKAGLAPMHTWLPDAHSQAISPVSAMLSGVLLKTAIYAILRFTVITNNCVGVAYTSNLFILFGIISLIISCGFILVQKRIKRLLAYSSIEHVGIIVTGLGLGGLGWYGALLHIFNHAVTKSFMFFGAARVVKKYKKDNLNVIKGVLSAMPFCGVMLILGMFAISGMPPFSIFFSELFILISGFTQGRYFISGLVLTLLAIIFGAIVYHLSRILFGKKPQEIDKSAETLSTKLSFLFLLVLMCVVGIKVPIFLNKIILASLEILKGNYGL
ncbi:MAG: proton-conducting transporter membrane subunit [Candidatus Omnitrophica bacterium]|nr:proton-conducting transporter membrane subunit [Candidatus Omnitrophota bacterium]